MAETASLVIKVDSSGAARASGDLDRLGRSAQDAEGKIGLIPGAMKLIGTVAASAAIATATGAYIRMADASANMAARLKLATGSTAEFNRAQTATYQLAQRTSSDLESVVNLYARLSQSSTELGLSQNQITDVTEAVTLGFQLSGASAQEASGGIRQLTQAMAGGTLRAEEFNSIIESAPRIVQALADHFGVSFGKVRQLVNEGKISSEEFAKALQSGLEEMRGEFDTMPTTVGRATQKVRNALMGLVGDADEASGATSGLAEGIEDLAKLLESQSVKNGFAAIIGGLTEVTGWAARASSEIATFTKRVAEGVAARLHGAALDDIPNMELEAGRLRGRVEKWDSMKWRLPDGAMAPGEQAARDRLALLERSIRERRQQLVTGGVDSGIGYDSSSGLNAQWERELAAWEPKGGRGGGGGGNGKEGRSARTGGVDRASSILDTYSFSANEIREEARAINEARAATEGWTTRIEDLRAELAGPLATATLAYQRALEQVNAAQAAGHITTEQAKEAQRLLGDQFEETAEKIKDSSDDMSEFAIQAARNMQSTFSDLFYDPMADGASGMADRFADALRRMAADLASSKLLEAVGGWASSYTGAGSGWINALGGAMQGGGRAFGGPVQAGQSYRVGERGESEIFVPNTSGRIVPGGDSGRVVNNITIHEAPPGTQVTSRQNASGGMDMDVLVGQLEKRMAGNVAQGASPFNPALESRYNMQKRV